jgi:hypothetical protein
MLIARIQHPRLQVAAFCRHAPVSPLIAVNCALFSLVPSVAA